MTGDWQRIQRELGERPPATDAEAIENIRATLGSEAVGDYPDPFAEVANEVQSRARLRPIKGGSGDVTTTTPEHFIQVNEVIHASQPSMGAPALAYKQDILAEFTKALPGVGLVGEDRNACVLYLAITSRLLRRPVSVGVKGTSSVGKSWTMEVALRFFPEEAYFGRTTMSPKALIYSKESFEHRMLVIYEAAGMANEDLQYVVRSLLSEGKIVHDSVQPGTLKPIHIEKDGPTGLLISTTRISLHPENETRLVSITANDTADQTAAVMGRLADEGGDTLDVKPWLELQEWLTTAEHRVTVPYAKRLAELVPPVAVRLRRDFQTVLSFVRAHAILHQLTRERDTEGAIVATLEDYAAVRALIVDLISEGVGKSVKVQVRETVAAVAELEPLGQVTFKRLGERLKLDTSTARRRALDAISGGYVKNTEEKGKPAALVVGDPLPDDVQVLPLPEELEEER